MRVELEDRVVHVEPELGECSSCKASVLWVVMATTRKRMPLDIDQDDEGGNVVWPWAIAEDGIALARVEHKDELGSFRGKRLLYRAHFATCPDAAARRRPRKGRK